MRIIKIAKIDSFHKFLFWVIMGFFAANATMAKDNEKPKPIFGIQSNSASIRLIWTAPGDDGQSGTAHHYDIRYSTEIIMENNWYSCYAISNPPLPLPAGSIQDCLIENLVPGELYYFGIKAFDEAGNSSGLSNISQRITNGIQIPPLRAALIDSVNLAATLRADTIHCHRQIRYEFAIDTLSNFGQALLQSDSQVDSIAAVTFSQLQSGKTYFWRCRAIAVDLSDSSFWSLPDSFEISTSMDLPPTVTLISPNGRERWRVNSRHQIVWSDNDDSGIAQYLLSYSTNNGNNWILIQNWRNGDPHSFNWTIPNTLSRYCRVRISCRDFQGNVGSDISNQNFTISGADRPRVLVAFPNEYSTIEIGIDTTIIWTADDTVSIDSFMIDYSTNGGADWDIITAYRQGNPGSYCWIVPPIISLQCLIRVTCKSTDDEPSSDTSAVFELSDNLSPVLEILNPTDYQSLPGDSIVIEWQAADNGLVVADTSEYSIDDGISWLPITAGENRARDSYNWDTPIISGAILLRVLCVDQSGNIGADTVILSLTTLVNQSEFSPVEFALLPAYPNPFNPTTTIQFAVPEPSQIKIEIYDLMGRSVGIIADGNYSQGYYQALWEAGELPSGIYFCRLRAVKFIAIEKLSLLK